MPAIVACRQCGASFEAKRMDAMFCIPCKELRAKERAATYDTHHKDPCPQCSNLMVRRSKLCKTCDNKSRATLFLGANNPNWREGRTMAHGYVLRRITAQKHATGTNAYRLEHRMVWEEAHGPLPKGHIIHHLNGIKSDNRLENLAAMSRADHHIKHSEPYEERIRQLEAELLRLSP